MVGPSELASDWFASQAKTLLYMLRPTFKEWLPDNDLHVNSEVQSFVSYWLDDLAIKWSR